MTVRYGLIGAGYLGRALARAFARRDDAVVTAVYDPAVDADFLAELGARGVDDWREVCAADDVDAVIVASPNWAHHEQVIAAAEHGKAVFCEKPVALSHEHVSDMVRACADAGVLFMAGHVTHFMSGVRRTKQLIAEGAIGDIVHCRAVRNTWEAERDGKSWKKQRALSGGHLYHHIHELDLVLALLGPASVATMVGGNVAHHGEHDGDEDDVLAMLLEFDGRRFATLEYGSAFRWAEHYVLIQGTLGAIRLGMQGEGCELRSPSRTEKFLLHRDAVEEQSRADFYARGEKDAGALFGTPDSALPAWLGGIIEDETAYFDGLMRGEAPLAEFTALTDGSAALNALATADALTLSREDGRKVRIDEATGSGRGNRLV